MVYAEEHRALSAHYELEALCERTEALNTLGWHDESAMDVRLTQAALEGLVTVSQEGLGSALKDIMARIRKLFEAIWEGLKAAGRRLRDLFDRTEKRRQATEEQIRSHTEPMKEDIEVRFDTEARGRDASMAEYEKEIDELKTKVADQEEKQRKQSELLDEVCELLEVAIQDARDSENPDVQRKLDEMFEDAVLESMPSKLRHQSPMDRRKHGDVEDQLYILGGIGRRTHLGKLTRRNGRAIAWKESWVKDFRHEKYDSLAKMHASNLDSLISTCELVGSRLETLKRSGLTEAVDADSRRLFRRVEAIGEQLDVALKTESFPPEQAPAIRGALMRISRALRQMAENANSNTQGQQQALSEAVSVLSQFEKELP